jgi:hypothetical protein
MGQEEGSETEEEGSEKMRHLSPTRSPHTRMRSRSWLGIAPVYWRTERTRSSPCTSSCRAKWHWQAQACSHPSRAAVAEMGSSRKAPLRDPLPPQRQPRVLEDRRALVRDSAPVVGLHEQLSVHRTFSQEGFAFIDRGHAPQISKPELG